MVLLSEASMPGSSREALAAALHGLEVRKVRLDEQIAQVRLLLTEKAT